LSILNTRIIMEIMKLLPKPKHPASKPQQPPCVRETHWEDPLDMSDINRHCTQFKRCANATNNKSLKVIECSVDSLLEKFNDYQ
jgi:hypothetical protein